MKGIAKDSLRIEYRNRRKGFAVRSLEEMAGFVAELFPQDGLTLAGYVGFNSELPFHEVMQLLPQYSWVIPRVEGKTLSFYQFQSLDQLIQSRWGVPEPNPQEATKVSLADCEAVFVPGLAFDRRGHRLGSGLGYYDRALSEEGLVKIGVGYSVQISNDQLPAEAHDVNMNFLLCEKFLLEPREV